MVPVQESPPEGTRITIWTEKVSEAFLLSHFSDTNIILTTMLDCLELARRDRPILNNYTSQLAENELGAQPSQNKDYFIFTVGHSGQTKQRQSRLDYIKARIHESDKAMVAMPTIATTFGRCIRNTAMKVNTTCSCQFATPTSNYHCKWSIWTKGF